MKSHLHCDIDAEKPFIKYVCIFLLYAQDCDKHSFENLQTSEVFER